MLEAAHDLASDFADGVYFVPLAAISEPAFVLPTIAQALGVRETGARALLQELQAVLSDQSLLLLLDNFEQVVAAAPSLAALLAFCPQVKLLVTSRAVLRLQGERELVVFPLALPNLAQEPTRESLQESAACALFVERAQGITPDFAVTQANVHAIAEICIRLDGLPLAIELAAARTRLLSPQALLSRLTHRLDVLTGGVRNAPDRQQTMRATIAWSYQLLTYEDQQLFRWLSVFAGGCTLQAVEAIIHPAGLLDSQVLDGVSMLLENHLLRQVEQSNGESRLLMLETIREFGLERLSGEGEAEKTRRAHASYYLALAEEAETALTGPEEVTWLERLEQEHENLRGALQWLLEQAEGVQTRGDETEMALRLAGALWRFWSVRGHLSEGRHWLERVLAGERLQAGTQVATSVRAKALTGASWLAVSQGDSNQAEVLCRESLELYRELGEKAGMAFSLLQLGSIAHSKNNYAQACSLLEEALRLFSVRRCFRYTALPMSRRWLRLKSGWAITCLLLPGLRDAA